MMATRSPGLDGEGQVGEHVRVLARVAERDLVDRDCRAIQLLRLLEADVGILARGGADLLELDLLQLLLARGRLPGLGGIGREAPHELLQIRDLVARLGVGGLDTRPRLHRGEHEVVVVARVDLQLLVIEIRDVRAHLVQEMPVVADDHHGGVVVVERAFQPADRMDVQVVRGLVQQQHVRLREQRLREQHAQLQSRRHLAHRSVVARLVDAGIGENAAGARLGVVAAVLREHRLELRRAHEVRIGGVRVGVDAVALGHRLPELGVALHHHVEDALILIAELVLVQFARAASRSAAPHRPRSRPDRRPAPS